MFDSIYGTYLSKLRKPVADRKSAKVFKGHKSSLLLAKQYEVTKDLEVLKVKNLKSNISYDIVLIHGEAHECHQACLQCGFCVHTFQCSCNDNRLFGKFCIHLHLLSQSPNLLPKFERPINAQFDVFYSIIKPSVSATVSKSTPVHVPTTASATASTSLSKNVKDV